MNLSNNTKAILAVFGSQLIWGIAGPLVKIVLNNAPPMGLMYFRFLLTTLILFLIFEFNHTRLMPRITPRDKKKIFLAGFLGVFVNITCYFLGQKLTTVIDAWVITSSGTLFVIAYSFIFQHERLAKKVYLGAAIAFVGTIIIIGNPILNVGSGSLTGNILMLVSALSGVSAFMITKTLVEKFHPLVLTYYFFLISLFFALPLFLWEYWQNPRWIATLSPQSIGILLYLVLGSSIAAYTLQSLGLKHLSPSLAATLGYSSAVISVTLSIIFLHEKPTEFFIIGTSLVIVGLFLAETRHPNHPIHKLLRK